jgi:hypothetical protein
MPASSRAGEICKGFLGRNGQLETCGVRVEKHPFRNASSEGKLLAWYYAVFFSLHAIQTEVQGTALRRARLIFSSQIVHVP